MSLPSDIIIPSSGRNYGPPSFKDIMKETKGGQSDLSPTPRLLSTEAKERRDAYLESKESPPAFKEMMSEIIRHENEDLANSRALEAEAKGRLFQVISKMQTKEQLVEFILDGESKHC